MEGVLGFLEQLLLICIGIFALYLCFQVGESGALSRPAAGWTARVCLIVVAAACFFTVAHVLGSR